MGGRRHAAPWSAAYIKEDTRAAMPEGMIARVYWLQHLDEAQVGEMIALLAGRQIFVDPTLMATMHTKFWADDPRWTQNPDLAYVRADLVLLPRNPLDDITNSRAVDPAIQNGHAVFTAPSRARQ